MKHHVQTGAPVAEPFPAETEPMAPHQSVNGLDMSGDRAWHSQGWDKKLGKFAKGNAGTILGALALVAGCYWFPVSQGQFSASQVQIAADRKNNEDRFASIEKRVDKVDATATRTESKVDDLKDLLLGQSRAAAAKPVLAVEPQRKRQVRKAPPKRLLGFPSAWPVSR